jgi:hypothetical protein
MRSPRDGVRQHCIDSDCCQHESQRSKRANQYEAEAPACRRPADHFIHGADVPKRELAVQAPYDGANVGRESCRIGLAAHGNSK